MQYSSRCNEYVHLSIPSYMWYMRLPCHEGWIFRNFALEALCLADELVIQSSGDRSLCTQKSAGESRYFYAFHTHQELTPGSVREAMRLAQFDVKILRAKDAFIHSWVLNWSTACATAGSSIPRLDRRSSTRILVSLPCPIWRASASVTSGSKAARY